MSGRDATHKTQRRPFLHRDATATDPTDATHQVAWVSQRKVYVTPASFVSRTTVRECSVLGADPRAGVPPNSLIGYAGKENLQTWARNSPSTGTVCQCGHMPQRSEKKKAAGRTRQMGVVCVCVCGGGGWGACRVIAIHAPVLEQLPRLPLRSGRNFMNSFQCVHQSINLRLLVGMGGGRAMRVGYAGQRRRRACVKQNLTHVPHWIR